MSKIIKYSEFSPLYESCGGNSNSSSCGGYNDDGSGSYDKKRITSCGDNSNSSSCGGYNDDGSGSYDRPRIERRIENRKKKTPKCKCGTSLVSGAKFCHNCGKKIK